PGRRPARGRAGAFTVVPGARLPVAGASDRPGLPAHLAPVAADVAAGPTAGGRPHRLLRIVTAAVPPAGAAGTAPRAERPPAAARAGTGSGGAGRCRVPGQRWRDAAATARA